MLISAPVASLASLASSPAVAVAVAWRPCLGGGGLGHLDQRRERSRVGDGEVGEDLAVDLDAGQAQAGDEAAVAHAVLAGTGVDALDPELAEVTLAGPAVAVGVLQGVHDLLVGRLVAAALVAVVALGRLEDGAVVLPAVDGALDPGHGGAPFFVLSCEGWEVERAAGQRPSSA